MDIKGSFFDVNRYLTDDNRDALKKFAVKYLKDIEDTQSLQPADLDILLQIIADSAGGLAMKLPEVNRRLKAYRNDTDSLFKYIAVLSALRFIDVYYYDEFMGELLAEPICGPDGQPSDDIFPIYTSRARARETGYSIFDITKDSMEDAIISVTDAACSMFVINPGKDDCFFDIEMVESSFMWILDMEESFTNVLYDGVEAADLFPAMKIMFEYSPVECFMKDGSYLIGAAEIQDPDSDIFLLKDVNDAGYVIEDGQIKTVRFSDVNIIRYMEMEPDEDTDESEYEFVDDNSADEE